MDGPEVTANVTLSGGVVTLSFPGTAGQTMFVDVVSSTLADQCGVITLRDPGNNLLGSGCIIGGTGLIDATPLPTTGRYSIVVDPAGPNTGQTRLKLMLSVTDSSASIALNGPSVGATITGPGAVARLSFAGSAGQKVFVDVPSATVPDQCGVLTLRGPDNAALASGCVIGGTGLIDATALPTTGQYTIVVDPAQRSTGTAQTVLTSVTDQQLPIVLNGASVVATVAQPGAVSRLTFTATAGQSVVVEISAATLADECGIVTAAGRADRPGQGVGVLQAAGRG